MSATRTAFYVKNLPRLEKTLLALPEKVVAHSLDRALKAGARKFAEDAKLEAPFWTFRLINSLGIKAGRKSKWVVGYDARANPGTSRKDLKGAYYAHMVEFGHWVNARRRKSRKIKPGDKRTWVPENPFLRRAYLKNESSIIKNFEDRTLRIFNKELSAVK